ncbi:MAG: GNAT family N-acetyltransferase [Verrucomicrobiota bacterium]
MQIIRATPDDATVLTQIAFMAKRHWGYPENWIEHWRNILTITPEFIAAHETYAARERGEIVGFYALLPEASDLRLEHLWILPEAMNRGVGRALFQHALERSSALGFATLQIESDPNAVAFYERMGSRRVGQTITELDGERRELPLLVCATATSRQ